MDPEELQRQQQAAPPPPAEPVEGATVVLRDGSLADFDSPASAQAFLEANPEAAVAIDTPELRQRRALTREYGGAPIIGSALGALRGATVGLSSAAAGLLGLGEAEQAYREANPGAALTGEVLGTIGSMAYGAGEVGLGARGIGAVGRAITAPARAVIGAAEAAGAIAGRQIAAAAGGGAAARVIGRAGALATEGAIESAAYEAGGMLSEQTLRDPPELTAERVVSRLGGAAAFGGAAGAGLGGLLAIGGEARRAAGASAEHLGRAIRERLGRDAAPGVADLLADQYTRAAALARGVDPDTVGQFTRLTPEGREARQIVQEGPASLLNTGTRRLGADVHEVTRNLDPVFYEATGARKVDDIAATVRTDTLPDQIQIAQNAIDRTQEASDEFLSTLGQVQYQAVGQGRRMAKSAEAARIRLASAIANEDAARRSAEIFNIVDDLKRAAGQERRASNNREAQTYIRDMYFDHMMRPLENAAVWGDAITGIQTRTNARWHQFLNWDQDFTNLLLRRGEADEFRRIRREDSAKVEAYLRRIGTAGNDSSEQIFRDWLNASDGLTESIGEAFSLTPKARESLDRLRGAISRLRETHTEYARRASILNQWSELNGSQSSGLGGILGSAAATSAVLGSGVVAAPLALASAGVSAISNPGRVATYLGSLERLAAAQDTTISDAISSFLRRGSRAVAGATEATARGVERAGRAGLAAASAASVASRFRARSTQLAEDQRDPQQAIDRLSQQTRELERAAPNVAAGIGATVARGRAYLAATQPQGRRLPGQIFSPRTEPQPSPEQMRAWLRRVEAVDNPLSVLDSLREGTISREQVDALRSVYPQLYARIREEALRQIGDAASPLSYQDRIRLGVLLDAPTDPSLEPSTLAVLQGTFRTAGEAPGQPPTQPAPRVSQQLATGTERIAQRR